jgi:hypothetical protein
MNDATIGNGDGFLELATRNRAWAFEPVLAVSTVIWGRDGDSLFDVWSEKLQVHEPGA